MIPILFAAVAFAQQTFNPASNLRPGQWSTNRQNCAGNCRGIMNLSYTECVEFGFKNGGLDRRLGNIAVVDGDGTMLGTWTADRNRDGILDVHSCVPPRYTVWGNVAGLGTEVHIETVKYWTGVSHYTTWLMGVAVEIWGSYYAGTGEGIPSEGVYGNPNNVQKLNNQILLIGG